MRVVVVGAGLGGAATAARLARLGHDLTVVEAARRVGGVLGGVEADGFRWDAGPAATALPAVLRDLFRKTGRPLDRELPLEPVEPFREHRFRDGSRVALPSASRAAQIQAVDAGLGPGLGRRWADYLQSQAEAWELVRRDLLERRSAPETTAPETLRLLRARRSLQRAAAGLGDPRLRLMAGHGAVAAGHDPARVPAWLGLVAYLELKFGVWTAPDGLGGLADALARRLSERGVEVLTGTRATDVVLGRHGPRAVRTDRGDLDADLVVCAAPPAALRSLAGRLRAGPEAVPPRVTYLGLAAGAPDLPAEVVLHGREGSTVLRTRGAAPEGAAAWTVLRHGRPLDDPVAELGRWGLEVAGLVRVRLDRPSGWVSGSAYGPRWRRRGLAERLSTRTPLPGVHLAGAPAALIGTVPFVGLTAAVVADDVGPAEARGTAPRARPARRTR